MGIGIEESGKLWHREGMELGPEASGGNNCERM